MGRIFGRTAVITAIVAAGTVFGWLYLESRKEQPRSASVGLTGADVVRESADGQSGNLLKWWEDRLQAAERNGKWDAAADYAYRMAAYYRSADREKEAEHWYAASDAYRTKAEPRDNRFYDEALPSPQEVVLTPYVGVPATENRQLAKFEPQSGAYLGMFGIFDYPAVEQTFGRYHPIGLHYSGWRKDENDTRNYFPTRTINSVKAAGAGGALQIGWEPQYGLDAVKDDEYVRSFARQAKEAGIPIFLRYASEMNGNWVPWYDEPQKYVEKFRLVSRIIKEEAPNVAMVWSPNFWPQDNIDAYYPGDEYVDWVGFSLYSTPYYDGKEDFSKNQIDYFIPLYEKYKHKPIMIAEGAISHYNTKTNKSHAKWAEGQISIMYGFLPKMFPQVKAITYFNMSKSRSESLKSEFIYDIKENPLMYDQYRKLIQSDYFLTKVEQGTSAKENIRYVPLATASGLQGKHKLFVYPDMPFDSQPHSVAVFQGEKRLAVSYEVPWEVEIDFSSLQADVPLTIVAYNGRQETLARQSFDWSKR
ncbi:glycoside hydrolase family 26 protein [Paenibacillus hemerocallicola]|nr:glycosyl hydrolase [Paenibacillus hemerocallicola]